MTELAAYIFMSLRKAATLLSPHAAILLMIGPFVFSMLLAHQSRYQTIRNCPVFCIIYEKDVNSTAATSTSLTHLLTH